MDVYQLKLKLSDGNVLESRLVEGLYTITNKRDLAYDLQTKEWIFEAVAKDEGEAYTLALNKREAFLWALKEALTVVGHQ